MFDHFPLFFEKKMAKVRENEEGGYHFEFNCPGCGYVHGFYTKREGWNGPTWLFNGNLEYPTVSPSILMTTSQSGAPYICHSFITCGIIQFLGDCTHKLSGQTIELPEFE